MGLVRHNWFDRVIVIMITMILVAITVVIMIITVIMNNNIENREALV